MQPVDPKIGGSEPTPTRTPWIEYQPLPWKEQMVPTTVVMVHNGPLRIVRWSFTPEERALIAKGDDLYYVTDATVPLPAHRMHVGRTWEH